MRLVACMVCGWVSEIAYGMAPLTAFHHLPALAFEPINETVQAGEVQATLSSRPGDDGGCLENIRIQKLSAFLEESGYTRSQTTP